MSGPNRRWLVAMVSLWPLSALPGMAWPGEFRAPTPIQPGARPKPRRNSRKKTTRKETPHQTATQQVLQTETKPTKPRQPAKEPNPKPRLARGGAGFGAASQPLFPGRYCPRLQSAFARRGGFVVVPKNHPWAGLARGQLIPTGEILDPDAKPTRDETGTKSNPPRQANPERSPTQKPRAPRGGGGFGAASYPSFRGGVVWWVPFRGGLSAVVSFSCRSLPWLVWCLGPKFHQ